MAKEIPVDKEEIIKFCLDPKHVNYVCPVMRPGLASWMVELEYLRFTPDTPLNNGFHLSYCQWPDPEPLPHLTMAVITIDKSGQEFAESILWKHGLKKCESGLVPIVIDQYGQHEFFLRGPNVFVLSTHSKGAENVVYKNDPKLTAAADAHEKAICQKFFDDHEAWLNTPEGKAVADAFWADKPGGLVR